MKLQQRRLIQLAALVLWGSITAVQPAMAENYDLVILNGRVMDPETVYDETANVGIKNGQIEIITKRKIAGETTIDATGHVVAPGFIDIHAHGQNIGDYRMQAMQGVTTMLELESGVLPIDEWYDKQGRKNLPINYGASAAWTFARIATFSGDEPSSDAAYFKAAQGRSDWKMELATPEQQGQILAYVKAGLDQGALGIGINAGYAPGYGRKEYFALAELAAERDVATFTHVRYASNVEPKLSLIHI